MGARIGIIAALAAFASCEGDMPEPGKLREAIKLSDFSENVQPAIVGTKSKEYAEYAYQSPRDAAEGVTWHLFGYRGLRGKMLETGRSFDFTFGSLNSKATDVFGLPAKGHLLVIGGMDYPPEGDAEPRGYFVVYDAEAARPIVEKFLPHTFLYPFYDSILAYEQVYDRAPAYHNHWYVTDQSLEMRAQSELTRALNEGNVFASLLAPCDKFGLDARIANYDLIDYKRRMFVGQAEPPGGLGPSVVVAVRWDKDFKNLRVEPIVDQKVKAIIEAISSPGETVHDGQSAEGFYFSPDGDWALWPDRMEDGRKLQLFAYPLGDEYAQGIGQPLYLGTFEERDLRVEFKTHPVKGTCLEVCLSGDQYASYADFVLLYSFGKPNQSPRLTPSGDGL